MTPFALWMIRIPYIVFLLSLALIFMAWRLKWTANPPVLPVVAETPASKKKKGKATDWKTDWKTTALAFARQHSWTLILVAILVVFFIFLLLTAPPRLTGEIPISPAQAGRPFYSLRWLRTTLATNYALFWTWATLLCIIISLAVHIWAVIKRSRFAAQVGLLFISLTLAALGQWMIGANNLLAAKFAYGVAAIGFVVWAILSRKRVRADLEHVVSPPRWIEITFLIGLFALTTYARLYAFPAVPYGIEGDEAKWTAESVNVMMDGRTDTSGEYHRDALPVSYYLEAAYFRLFGANIFSARLEVITISIIATLVFYWLIRQIAPFPLAMLGSYLLSISIFDISASRLANVESHVKLWPILALALLAYAHRNQRWQSYLLSGAAVALGLLTYDTVWPLLLIVIILGLTEIIRHKDGVKQKAIRFAALIGPSILSIPLVVPYFVSRISYYNVSGKGWNADFAKTLLNNLGGVISTWFVQLRTDFLYNRVGPLLNSSLLPWLVFGFVLICLTLRQRFSHWTFAWVLFFILPVPILANSQMGRVVYPALPAVYGLVALGMFIFWNETARLLGNLKVIAGVICLTFLFWLPFLNLYIYFNEVTDATDRQMRREISDIAAVAGGTNHMLLLPVVTGADEPLANEYQVIEMSLHGKMPTAQIPTTHQTVPYDQFLPTLLTSYTKVPYLEIILDKTTPREREQRDVVYATLMRCFPNGKLTTGVFFDRYTLDMAARESPACIPVNLDLAPVAAENGTALGWALSRGGATQIRLECSRRDDSLIWIEAENTTQAVGWKPETAYVTDWSGSGFLMDSYGSQLAWFTAHIPDAGEGYVWVRYYKRAADNSPAFFSLGNQTFPFADSAPEHLNQWVWERLGPYTLNDSLDWTLTRPYSEASTKFMALFVDAVVFTSNPGYDPRTSQSYTTVPPQFFSASGQTQGTIHPVLEPGHYACEAKAVSPQPLVDALGRTPVTSSKIEFDVTK
jgi:hypothetical protein